MYYRSLNIYGVGGYGWYSIHCYSLYLYYYIHCAGFWEIISNDLEQGDHSNRLFRLIYIVCLHREPIYRLIRIQMYLPNVYSALLPETNYSQRSEYRVRPV